MVNNFRIILYFLIYQFQGQSGGHTAYIPSDNQWHQTRAQLLTRMDVGMGGRAAEELIFGADKVTGGASNDLNGTTNIAEAMVKNLAMSNKLGMSKSNNAQIIVKICQIAANNTFEEDLVFSRLSIIQSLYGYFLPTFQV